MLTSRRMYHIGLPIRNKNRLVNLADTSVLENLWNPLHTRTRSLTKYAYLDEPPSTSSTESAYRAARSYSHTSTCANDSLLEQSISAAVCGEAALTLSLPVFTQVTDLCLLLGTLRRWNSLDAIFTKCPLLRLRILHLIEGLTNLATVPALWLYPQLRVIDGEHLFFPKPTDNVNCTTYSDAEPRHNAVQSFTMQFRGDETALEQLLAASLLLQECVLLHETDSRGYSPIDKDWTPLVRALSTSASTLSRLVLSPNGIEPYRYQSIDLSHFSNLIDLTVPAWFWADSEVDLAPLLPCSLQCKAFTRTEKSVQDGSALVFSNGNSVLLYLASHFCVLEPKGFGLVC